MVSSNHILKSIPISENCKFFFVKKNFFVVLNHMKSKYSVLDILSSLVENKTNRMEVNYLIEQAYSFSSAYLKYRYKNLSRTLLVEDATLRELTLDSIAPLFERNEDGSFVRIVKAFTEWIPKIETEEHALFFLNRIVGRCCEKYTSELLRQSDPFFSKILDSINYLIKKKNYHKKVILGTVFILETNELIKLGKLPDSEFITSLPMKVFYNKKDIISSVFECVKKESSYIAAIPLNSLVMKIKKVRTGEGNFSDIEYDGKKELEINSLVNSALNVCYEKLKFGYIEKGKLSETEAVGIKRALSNVGRDMRDGGIIPGLHNYLMQELDYVDIDEYKVKYQNIFEYLYKILKNEIAAHLVD